LFSRKTDKNSRPKKVGQKSQQKSGNKRQQKIRQERLEKSLFLNLSCCCLETGLKPILFNKRILHSFSLILIGFVILWRNDISAKSACKMLMKLTTG